MSVLAKITILWLQVDPKPMDTMLHVISYDLPIKYLCPPALLGLLISQIIFDSDAGGYGGEEYPRWVHAVAGALVLGIMIISLLTFAVYPSFWDNLGVDENLGAQVAYYPVRVFLSAFVLFAHAARELQGCTG